MYNYALLLNAGRTNETKLPGIFCFSSYMSAELIKSVHNGG